MHLNTTQHGPCRRCSGAAAGWGAHRLAGLHGLAVHRRVQGRGVPKGNLANPAGSAGARGRRGPEVLGEGAHVTQQEGSSDHTIFHGAGTTDREKEGKWWLAQAPHTQYWRGYI